jgi:competence protein ComEA
MLRFLLALVVFCVIGGVSAAAAQEKASAASKSTGAPAPLVNLNTATAAQIATLPGIGEKAAERIIEYREKNGGFKKPEELMNVKGIGEKSFLKLKALVTVGEARPAAKQ